MRYHLRCEEPSAIPRHALIVGAVGGGGSTGSHNGNDICDIPESRFDQCGFMEEVEERFHSCC